MGSSGRQPTGATFLSAFGLPKLLMWVALITVIDTTSGDELNYPHDDGCDFRSTAAN